MAKNKVQFQKGLSVPDFMESYGTEEQCFAELVRMRWQDGFKCPKCGHDKCCQLKSRKNLFQCNSCRAQASVTAGTIYHATKLPLTKWFLAQHLLTQGKNGISQLELARQLGVSINTAAMLYHKLAQVMLERDEHKPLDGNIDVDDAYWGGKQAGKRGRGSKNKVPFLAAVEKNSDGRPMRIKLSVVAGFKKDEIKRWSKKHIQAGSSIASDGLGCFNGFKAAGFEHKATVVGNSKDPEKTAQFTWLNTILANLKTSLAGTFHKLSSEHLPRHLATFQYRFNRRFALKDLVPRLAYVCLRTPPMPRNLLKLAEVRW